MKEAKTLAHARLSSPGVRLTAVFSILLCMAFTVGGIYGIECIFFAVDWDAIYVTSPVLCEILYDFSYVLEAIVALLLGLPLVYGATTILQKLADGKIPPLSELFAPFGSGRAYGRALGLMLRRFLPEILIALTLWLADTLLLTEYSVTLPLGAVEYIITPAALARILRGVAIALTVLRIWFSGRVAAVFHLAYRAPERSVSEVFRASKRLSHGRLGKIFLFRLSFFGWALLSALLILVPAVVHVIPYYAFSLFYRIEAFARPGEQDQ